METTLTAYVAVDIAKDSLQIQTDHTGWSVPNTPPAITNSSNGCGRSGRCT